MGVFRSLIDGVYNLLLGLGVTARRLPKPAVTLQYPEERWTIPERSRGVVVLLSDQETGELNCTACLLCEKACPTGAISIGREKNEKGKWYAKSFTVDNTICCFCGLCEESCNFAALKMATMYEFSVYNQSELVYDINRLQELGRDVPYTPRPKKKPAPAAAPEKKDAAPAPKPPERPEKEDAVPAPKEEKAEPDKPQAELKLEVDEKRKDESKPDEKNTDTKKSETEE
jgi:NADH-quinone oxidoreductase subunit I